MEKVRGVNLGGWLVLERWITPSVFKGVMAQDEYGLCCELGDKKLKRLEEHRKAWITENDFAWIKDEGLEAVRLPVPHWVFGSFEPFVDCGKYVDWTFETAEKYGLKVLLDLHTAPGSQNGNDHSGRSGPTEWHLNPKNIGRTLKVVEKIAARWGKQPALLGIELLNEPGGKIPQDALRHYYTEAFETVRRHTEVPVIISDAYRPDVWGGELTDMVLDLHLYQVFSAEDKKRPIHKVIKKARHEWAETLAAIKKSRPAIVGEWSLALDRKSLRGLDEYERDKALQAYWHAQVRAFEETDGWFYWTYKTEDSGAWNFRDCVQRGWIQLPAEPSIAPRAYDAHA